jgi:hypothetical protein
MSNRPNCHHHVRKEFPRMKPSSASAHSADDPIEQLASAIDRLADEVRVLRDALDEFREDFRWAARNSQDCGYAPLLWTRVPTNSCASDQAVDIPDEHPPGQGVLWRGPR